MKVLYFAWFRDRIGLSEEDVTLPDGKEMTVHSFIDSLSARGEGYAAAFEDRDVVHVALDMIEVPHDTSISGVSEIAFYPPFTGG
ncbi:MAG: molybdopterin synthase sulfur carrier subunit [Rhodobiaceae bacterium]|nr:MAG: molybdopterin synthase sulfur carrier subunit [Rhodobiaceae bacterium]